MTYQLMKSHIDDDIPIILQIYRLPSITQFISINEQNYWQYVTSTENVWFYKVFEKDCLVATIHLELPERVLYMDIVVFPQYQRKGIGSKILNDIGKGKLGLDFDKIQVSIDESNIASIKLFEAAGFVCVAKDEELLEYEYVKN